MAKQINKNLTDAQKKVLFEAGTEPPFSGKYYKKGETGVYHCANCDAPLFVSETQFDSGCGWPSFYEPVSKTALVYHTDKSHGMKRTEVVCGNCGVHLGHVFPDAPQTPTGERYCINSAALELRKK